MDTAPALLACATALSLLGAGCTKKEPPPAETTASASPAPPSPQIAPAAVRTGIAECDEYVRKYEACMGRSSAPAAGAVQAFKAQRESFRIAAGTPEGKVSLPGHCRGLLDKLAADKTCAGGDPGTDK